MYELDDVRMAKGLHMVHLNIRSLVNKWDTFKVQFMSSNLHFIGLSETWLNDKIPDNILNLSNEYALIRNDRNWNETDSIEPKKGGAVATFIKNSLNYSEQNT